MMGITRVSDRKRPGLHICFTYLTTRHLVGGNFCSYLVVTKGLFYGEQRILCAMCVEETIE